MVFRYGNYLEKVAEILKDLSDCLHGLSKGGADIPAMDAFKIVYCICTVSLATSLNSRLLPEHIDPVLLLRRVHQACFSNKSASISVC